MIRLQSVLLPSAEVCDISELYYHKRDFRIDFNGYFNLFYLEKRKKYTQIKNLILELNVCGYCELILVHNGNDLKRYPLDSSNPKQYKIHFPYEQYSKGAFWFALVEDERITNRKLNGAFVTDYEPGNEQAVNIGIDICTFKRETYVLRNLKQLKERVLQNTELDVSSHVHIFVVDNGKTLDKHEQIRQLVESSSGKITIVPNKNAGGAGGFTRGMLEILKKKEDFTHVLLMDDDAVIEPDTLIRLYGFLSTVKKEWKDITVGGVMLREDYPYMLYCAGEWWEKGNIINPGMHLDIRDTETAMCDYLLETGHEHERYSGWWCCCYSLNTVQDNNLPIPLFLHHDDIEFGLRNKDKGIVFFNGIGIWHRGAELTILSSNLYYDIRNNLIEIALHQNGDMFITALHFVLKSLTSSAIQYKYENLLLIQKAVLDFLKGPIWLWKQEPESLNTEVRSLSHPLITLDELKEKLSEKDYRIVEKQIETYRDNFGMEIIDEYKTRKSKATWKHLITYNGWLLPANRRKFKVLFTTDSPFDYFRNRKIVLYEPSSGKVMLLQKDYGKVPMILKAYSKSLFSLVGGFGLAVRDYRKNIKRITNSKSWERYLGLDKDESV